jgi:hypothetical protein
MHTRLFQSPFHRGDYSDLTHHPAELSVAIRFNPLFIGAIIRTVTPIDLYLPLVLSFNPLV